VVSGSDLYVGGYFGTAGGKVSPYIARASLLTRPIASIVLSGGTVVLIWPTNAVGYTLQYTTNVSSVNWSNVIGGINIVGVNYTFTNKPAGNALFFRLMQ
jgi:hypothetical protein